MASAERNATRSVRMVAARTPSVAAATSRRPWSSRPKARRVGRPSTSWRKRPASDPEPAPLARRAPRRLPPEEDHGDRHGEHQRDDHDEGQPVLGGHPGQEEHGDDRGGRRLGEVARVVGVQRAQPPGGGERELARPLAGQPAGPEREGVAQQLARAGGVTTRSAAPWAARSPGGMQRGADQDGHADDDDRRARRRRAARGAGGNGPPRWARATAWTTTTTALRAPRTRATRGDPPQAGHPGRQLGIDQARPARARGGGAHRLNVVSFTSTVRPMRPSATARRAVACIFAGGGRPDPIGQVRHDGRADGVERLVGAAVGDGEGDHGGAARLARWGRGDGDDLRCGARLGGQVGHDDRPRRRRRRGGPDGQAGLGEHARHRRDQAQFGRLGPQPAAQRDV